MKRFLSAILLLAGSLSAQRAPSPVLRFPSDRAVNVNPDTHLVLTFPSLPTLGTSGQIRIYDAATNKLVDTLDLSIPPGPAAAARGAAPAPAAQMTPVAYEYPTGPRATNANTVPGTPSGAAQPTPATAQLTIIGGFTDAFHFYPVIIHDRTATIYLHHNLLDYNKSYYVQIDPGVLTTADGSFSGFSGTNNWTFSTKKSPPSANAARLVVAADGSGDFSTVQGALDFIPDNRGDNAPRVTIFILNGTYEEIVYFRRKSNVTLAGEDREKVVVTYANNEVFNPHPANVGTNEVPGTFPSRRATFMADNSTGIHLVNLSIRNPSNGQAEGLLITGSRNIVSDVNVAGSGDALQLNGSTYLKDCLIEGAGDTVLGRGPEFFDHCELRSRGVYMWIRNTDANHGNVFLNSTFRTTGGGMTEIARAPTNNGKNYPYAEAVLINCLLSGISPVGWGAIGGDASNIHYWEYNSRNDSDGSPVDISQRKPESRQLTLEKDADIIANYSNPEFVLGWKPAMAPILWPLTANANATGVTLLVRVAGIPAPALQWSRNGAMIAGATGTTLQVGPTRERASYSVTATNASGFAMTLLNLDLIQ